MTGEPNEASVENTEAFLGAVSAYRTGVGGTTGHAGMKMSVIFANGEVGAVPKDILDDSIRTKKIIAFLRSSGWVQVDRDPIRNEQSTFTGVDRRSGDSSERLSSDDSFTG